MNRTAAQTFHVVLETSRQTLAAALRQWLPGLSWGRVRRLIGGRYVLVNGSLCMDEARRLNDGEVVEVLPNPLPVPPSQEDVVIRLLDAHLVVVEKPAGMTTVRHPSERSWPARRKQLQPTLEEVVARLIRQRERPGGRRGGKAPLPRLRIVHRLDRDTSGLIVFARTAPAQRHLVQQFGHHTVRRCYLAIVHGHIAAQTIRTQLVRDRGDGRRGSTAGTQSGKRAVTHVRPLEKLGEYSLIECRLETGRTHQIRIHLSELGHMVCGEKVYRGAPFADPLADESGAVRHALHAAELGFQHPLSGERLHFTMPLPRDLRELYKRLRARAAS